VAQMKGEYLILLPENADGFRATISALRSLGEGEGVTFHTFSLPEDRCLRLWLKNLGKRMPEAEIKGELEALRIHVQAVMQLRSQRRDQDVEKDRPLTPYFIVSVARGPDIAKVRSLTELCGLRVKVETYNALKGPLQCKRYQRFGHTQRNCGYAPRCVACGDAHPSGKCHPKAAAEAVAAEETTLLTIVVAVSGKKQRRPLKSEHKLSAVEGMVFPLVCTHLSWLNLCQLLNRRHLVLAGTTLSKGSYCQSSLYFLSNPHHIRSGQTVRAAG
jgi:hypothetical protein